MCAFNRIWAIILIATIALSFGASRVVANELRVQDDTYFVILPDSSLRAKFQIRLEAPVFLSSNDYVWGWLQGLHLFYNQRSFWEIGEPSAPFSEHNFNPGVAYIWSNEVPFTCGIGYEHMSNGLDGEDSRSLDRGFVQPSWHGIFDRIDVSVRAWAYSGETEPVDLHRYWGYAKPIITYRHDPLNEDESWRVRVSGHRGTDSDFYGIESTITYPLKLGGFNPLLVANWFYGYGERMLTLEEKENIFRIGFGFVVPGTDAIPFLSR